MADLYDELDAQGAVVRSAFALGPYNQLPPGHTWQPHSVTLAEARALRRQQIEEWRDAACTANAVVPVSGAAHVWQADDRSQQLMGQAVSLANAGAIPAPAVWRTADNQDVAVTLQDLKNIAGTIAGQTSAAYAHSWALKAALDTAGTIDAVNAVIW